AGRAARGVHASGALFDASPHRAVLSSSRGNLNDVWNAMATARYRQWEVESSMRKRKQQQL
ncbi:unnamed protein product, partial [Closterium sp. NIES-54]